MNITKEEVINKLEKYFQEKAKFFHIDLAFLFGSFSRGYLKEESDVDVAIIFSDEVVDDKKCFELLTEISLELNLLINLEINTISINKDFTKPMLYYNAIVLGKPVYIRDKSLYTEIYNKALFHMHDFEIFGTKLQFKAAKTLLKQIKND
jgi:predicted nucleotidyltransferase